jgi:putative transposase
MTGESAGRRRSLRLKGYDYTQAGAYFVTICAQDQACLFGNIVDRCMYLNEAGHLLATQWHDIPARFAGVEIDTFVVMPNHVHGIIVLPDAANGVTAKVGPALGEVVAAFKSATTVHYIRRVKTSA